MSRFNKKLIGAAVAVSLAAGAASAMADNDRYIVKFKKGHGQSVKTAVQGQGGKIKLDLARHNAVAVEMSSKAMQGLSNNPNIEFVEADVKRFPLMAQTTPYGIPMVQADLLSDNGASNRKVCIIDSGYELAHEDLGGNMVSGTNDPGTGNWYTDENHHGTHVAGTVAALNNSTGVVGVLPNGNINLHIIKVFDAAGWAYSSSLVTALDHCMDAGSNVVSMSLGGSRSSRTEKSAFASALSSGVLSIAAAGNDGNNRHSYPASYDGVVSVAAVDSNKQVASFSQFTSQVELAAPGVGVLSSVPMGTALVSNVNAGGSDYEAIGMDGSISGTETGALADCGTGETACADAVGKVCLIQRGNISFADKANNCAAGGGIAAVIYNNEPGALNGTFGEVAVAIPGVGVSDTDGAALLGKLGQSTTVSIEPGNYAYFDGTSMATPHVSGVAALVWSHHLNCSASEIRNALAVTAEDLGAAGRDDYYGHGLVQARDAVDYLTANPCTGDGGGDPGPQPCKGKKCN